MIRFSLSAVLWTLWILAFFVHEFYALPNKDDGWIPLTWVVREAIRHSFYFRLLIAVVLPVWLFFHFGGPAVLYETWRKLVGAWL